MVEARARHSLRILFALLIGVAVISMHQLSDATSVHTMAMTAANEIYSIHHNGDMVMPADGHHTISSASPTQQRRGGDDAPTNCIGHERSCHATTTNAFVLPVNSAFVWTTTEHRCFACSKYAAARVDHDPPGKARLSVWRI